MSSVNQKNPRRALFLFRLDLRLQDNPALNYIAENYDEVLCAFVHAPSEEGKWVAGAASQSFLHFSLQQIDQTLQSRGGNLYSVEVDSTLEHIQDLVTRHDIQGLFWNRRYEPKLIERDRQIKEHFLEKGLEVKSFNASLLWEPWEIKNQQGNPFQVFTPFWKKATSLGEPNSPQKLSKNIRFMKVKSDSLDSLQLLSRLGWDRGFYEHFHCGEEAAKKALDVFAPKGARYQSQRDLPSVEGTSRLSPHLHFGSMSVREVWHRLRKTQESTRSNKERAEIDVYLKELGWREFAHHLLFHFPMTPDRALREKFAQFPWVKNASQLRKWQKGLTGYPIVDAGMRELWATGWMHNRVRMVVASFLVKHLRISWLEGAKWFWDTLIDADLASNTMGWQWAGGCGADAAPYFRIFNPYLQGAKFDPEGDYVKRWIPELSALSKKWIHAPHEAPEEELKKAGIVLGKTYPFPMVDHKEAREAALLAFKQLGG